MVCHVHPGTTVMNSYIGYMWYDEETHAELMYPAKQKNPTAEELIRSMLRNPNESANKSNRLSGSIRAMRFWRARKQASGLTKF